MCSEYQFLWPSLCGPMVFPASSSYRKHGLFEMHAARASLSATRESQTHWKTARILASSINCQINPLDVECTVEALYINSLLILLNPTKPDLYNLSMEGLPLGLWEHETKLSCITALFSQSSTVVFSFLVVPAALALLFLLSSGGVVQSSPVEGIVSYSLSNLSSSVFKST